VALDHKGSKLEGAIYSSSPFAKALVRHRRFMISFDVFPLASLLPLPSRLTAPLVFILDCTFPVVTLPSDLSWPWQLTPYPTKVKCLGLHQGEKVGADITLAPCRLLESMSSQLRLLPWQPVGGAMQQAYLWELCDRTGAFEGFDPEDYELLGRQCVVAYARRLEKELQSDNEEATNDGPSPPYMEDIDVAELATCAFTLHWTKDKALITRNDTRECQTWSQFRAGLALWQRDVNIHPSVVSIKDGLRYMQWQCPWRLDMSAKIPQALGEPLTLC
jgi:hypothetical protein